MSTFYLNHSTGNDANDGSSWALAWKSITSGATAARTAPGDIIRVAKTPDPTLVGNATWTDLSTTVTLAAAVTATVDMCATAWTPASNVTCDTTSTCKEGSLASQITIGASFTTGKVAYKTISDTDFSAYQQISLWIRTTVATTALKICLCSDTIGDVLVDELVLPAISVINAWHPIVVNKGSALGASIQSVALYAIVEPGVPVIILDNIIGCKAAASADSLSLKSLISKNDAAAGGTDSWHGIQSINGATVKLDNGPATTVAAARGYAGATETVATYKRETVEITAVETMNESGTEALPINYQCGFNTLTDLQDGETFLDGVNGTINGVNFASREFITVSRLSVVRCAVGLTISSHGHYDIDLGSVCNNGSHGISIGNYANIITVRDVCNNVSSGIYISSCYKINLEIINANGNIVNGIYLLSSADNRISCISSKNNGSYGICNSNCRNTRAIIHTSDNVLGGIWLDYGSLYLNKSTIEEATEVTGLAVHSDGVVFSTLHDNTPMSNKIYMDGATIVSQSAVRQTVSGVAWKISPTSIVRNSYNPVILPIARIAVDSGAAISVFAWFLRDNVDITGKLVCRKGQLAGLTSDQIDTITAGIDTWEELSVTFTPTESGVVEIEAWVYGGTTYSVYVDSIRIS
ncbi:MAG: right-handed parallel beta-helix repeat-containing protein [Kiritimatiellae bacterium]|nr:right-handed parallel beta-helix repeat-containing protein [Kiritimatiellia bacterium]